MKKTLLPRILVLFILSVLFGRTSAQCPTCHDGAHWSVINDSTHHLPPNVTPNGNDAMGTAPSFIFQNICGLNYVTVSVETTTRESSNPGTGFPATFTLPACLGAPLHAYLFWGVSYWEASPPNYTVTITNPVPNTTNYPTVNNIGTGPSKCWGEVGTAAYECDVTGSLGVGGLYSVTINGPSTSSDEKEIDGFTLVYIYNSGAAYSGSIALWDGDDISSSGSPLSATLNGFSVCAAPATASGFTSCGDEQANISATHTDLINGTTGTFNNSFWNTDIIPLTLTAGQTTCAYEPYSSDAGDCYSWILSGLYWQNTSCVVCTPTALTVTIPTFVNPTCGNNNGSADATVTGGTPPYTYLWTPGNQTTANATGLSAGTYTVTVEDATGCTTVTATVTLTTSQLTVNANTTANEPCNGNSVGSASSTVTGGTAPFTYTWTPAGGTNANASGLSAGTYTITVKDNSGCTGTATVTITQPPPIVVTATPVNILCNGGVGSATTVVTGGTPNYTYAWTPIGGTNATGTGLTVGTYTVNVTDANGCTGSTTVAITQPPVLTATTTMTQANCGNANGTATVTAGGGTPNYTYSWAPSGGTNATATGLTAGSYTVTVTDANSCTTTSVIVVTSSGGITVTMGANTNDPCNNSTSATATVNVTGGTMPYTYAWTPTGGTNATGTGMTAGTYTVTVTDANGCNGTATVTITSPPALVATMGAPTDPSCAGGNNGSATVAMAGGTPPYTYAWTPIGGTNATGSGLSAGTYTVNVTDNNGCTTSATVTLVDPPAINIITTTVAANCNQSDGSATAAVTGGTGAYTYSWAPVGGTNATATGLSANTYTVTVTDNNGCTQTATAVVSNLNGETATMGVITNVSCFNGTNGTATVNVVGGSAPYTYSWAPSGQTNATATGLSAGTYVVTVTDANGCTSLATAIITMPSQLVATMGAANNILCAGGTGSATVTVTGGTGPYTYAWTPAGGTNAMGTGLTANTYTVNIADNNGCTTSSTVTITAPLALTATISATNNVSCSGGNNGSLAVTAAGGTAPYTYAWTPAGGSNAIANSLTAGIYTITVTDANGCTATATGTINQPNAITITTTSTQTSCQPTGTATATAAGGTAPYTYKWTPSNQTTATATALAAGTYTVTVTDNDGCTETATATVTSLNAVTATMGAIVNVTCFGGNNGTATVTAASGTAPYTYSWSPIGGTNATGSGLSAGTYTVTVKDNNGCSATAAATIAQPNQMLVSATGTPSVCSGQPASLDATVNGGTGPYVYTWTPLGGNGSSASVTPLTTTTYTISVADANGCSASTTITVNVNPVLALLVSGSTAVCPGSTATFTATGSGGDGIYTYVWSNGAHTQTISVTPDSTEVLTVTLSDGCSTPLTVPVTVTVDPLPNVKFDEDIAQGCYPLCVQFHDLSTISSGGMDKWVWYFGDGDSVSVKTPTYCYNTPGNYNVTLTVVSDSGCSSSLRVLNLINVYSHPIASFTYSPNPVTILTPTLQFTDNSSDPYGIMQWQWSFGDGTDSASSLQNPSHTYQDTGTFCAKLEVVDVHGCVDTTTNCIDIQPLFTFYIPDAFTPNSDGINDVFLPKGTYIKTYEMYIFDRWGMELFHTTNILDGWDGTVNGGSTVSQEDTYVYLIKVTDTQGTDHNYTGKVSLIK